LLEEVQDTDPLLIRRKRAVIKPVEPGFILEAGDSLVLAGSLNALKIIAARLL